MKILENIKSEIKTKTEGLILDLSAMFGSLDSIELFFDEDVKGWLLNNLSVLCEFDEAEELFYEDIEIELKETLRFRVKKEFAEKFLAKELGFVSIEEEALLEFIKAARIYFYDRNVLKIKSENCRKYPKVTFVNPTHSNLERAIIKGSTCKEIQSIQLRQFFENNEFFTGEIARFISPKLNYLLKDELTIIQSKLNDYCKNKMDWIIRLNDDYIKQLS